MLVTGVCLVLKGLSCPCRLRLNLLIYNTEGDDVRFKFSPF